MNVKEHKEEYADLYAPGALTVDRHQDLVLEIDVLCRIAGIRKEWVARKMSDVCSAKELEWVSNSPTHARNDIAGLVYVGVSDVEDRMNAMCGAFLRNFIDARVVTVQQLIEPSGGPNPTVLLCPNFFLAKGAGGDVAQWESTRLYGLLLQRFNQGRLSVLYVADMDVLGTQYGAVFQKHIERHYTEVCS